MKAFQKRQLEVKKTVYFLFCLALFFLPSQNGYLNALAEESPSLLAPLTVEVPPLNPYPENFTGKAAPFLTARSVLVVDLDSQVVLFSKSPSARFLPASTVKMMTALVAFDQYQLNQVLTVKTVEERGQTIGLKQGERLTVRALLYALLVSSANDAAEVLAQNYPGGRAAFLVAMNQKAKFLNLTGSYFASPSGLDYDKNNKLLPSFSYSSPWDLARLAAELMKNPVLAKMVTTREILITDVRGEIVHPLLTINQLLGEVRGLKGVKTGWTEEAGECLVSLVERDGRRVILVVLGSLDRFGETARLAEWVFANFEWQTINPTIPD